MPGVGKGITKYMGSTALIESVGEVGEGAKGVCRELLKAKINEKYVPIIVNQSNRGTDKLQGS